MVSLDRAFTCGLDTPTYHPIAPYASIPACIISLARADRQLVCKGKAVCRDNPQRQGEVRGEPGVSRAHTGERIFRVWDELLPQL